MSDQKWEARNNLESAYWWTIYDGAGQVVARLAENNSPKNARFIVECVNSHARLVEALEKIASWYEATTSDCKECGGSKIAREALAALKDAGRKE